MTFIGRLFKTEKEADSTLEIDCPVCEHKHHTPRSLIATELQREAPMFICNGCLGDITAGYLKHPIVAKMLSDIESLRFKNDAAKESVSDLREPGRKELAAKEEQTALVKLQTGYDALSETHAKVLLDNRQLREQNDQLRAGMEAAAAHVRLLKAQLDAVPEPSISFFIEVGDAKTGTRVRCKGCTSELALHCPKCGYYHVLTVEMRGKDSELILLRRLCSDALPGKRDPISGYLLVEATP